MLIKFATKKDQVLADLRKQILSGRYPPGSRLVLRRIAETYGISDIPVREALNQLEKEGLIRITPHVGAVVTPLSADDLQDLFEVRVALELLATEKAVPRLQPADLEAIEAIQVELEQAYKRGDDAAVLSALNRRFHERLYQCSGNRRLLQLLSDLWDHATRYPPPLRPGDLGSARSIEEHWGILDALKAGAVKAAVELTRAHKNRSMADIVSRVRAQAQAQLASGPAAQATDA